MVEIEREKSERNARGGEDLNPPALLFPTSRHFIKYKCFYWLNNENNHKNSFIGPNIIWDPFYYFTRCFASSRRNLCTLVLATSLISLLHTVLDGGPRKWTYKDPSKPMTYQHAPRQRVHKYTMSFGDAILYLSRLKSFLNTFKCSSNTSCQVILIQTWSFDSIIVTLP